jgi:3-methyladenine DNA glycosylase Tag
MPASAPPKRARPRSLSGYLEPLAHAMFQAGISWRVVQAKWDGIKDALYGFDPERIAQLGPSDIDALVDNAQTMLELDREHGGFRRYLESLGGYDETVADLKRQFRFIGGTGAYYFLYVVGEDVPSRGEAHHR